METWHFFRKIKKPLFGLREVVQIFCSFLVLFLIKSLCQQRRNPNGGHDAARRLAGKITRPEGASVRACVHGTRLLLWGCWWDRLGPGSLYWSARTWTNSSLSNRTQRNYKGLKITWWMHSWGQFWLIQKDQNPTVISEVRGAHSTTMWAGRPPKPPFQPDPLVHPTLTSFKGPARPATCRGQARAPVHLFLLPTAAVWVPVKPCLNFLSDLLSISID